MSSERGGGAPTGRLGAGSNGSAVLQSRSHRGQRYSFFSTSKAAG